MKYNFNQGLKWLEKSQLASLQKHQFWISWLPVNKTFNATGKFSMVLTNNFFILNSKWTSILVALKHTVRLTLQAVAHISPIRLWYTLAPILTGLSITHSIRLCTRCSCKSWRASTAETLSCCGTSPTISTGGCVTWVLRLTSVACVPWRASRTWRRIY